MQKKSHRTLLLFKNKFDNFDSLQMYPSHHHQIPKKKKKNIGNCVKRDVSFSIIKFHSREGGGKKFTC